MATTHRFCVTMLLSSLVVVSCIVLFIVTQLNTVRRNKQVETTLDDRFSSVRSVVEAGFHLTEVDAAGRLLAALSADASDDVLYTLHALQRYNEKQVRALHDVSTRLYGTRNQLHLDRDHIYNWSRWHIVGPQQPPNNTWSPRLSDTLPILEAWVPLGEGDPLVSWFGLALPDASYFSVGHDVGDPGQSMQYLWSSGYRKPRHLCMYRRQNDTHWYRAYRGPLGYFTREWGNATYASHGPTLSPVFVGHPPVPMIAATTPLRSFNYTGGTWSVPNTHFNNANTAIAAVFRSTEDLSQFLARMKLQESGYCFLLEVERQGGAVVVAHPNFEGEVLYRTGGVYSVGGTVWPVTMLRPAWNMTDPVGSALVRRLGNLTQLVEEGSPLLRRPLEFLATPLNTSGPDVFMGYVDTILVPLTDNRHWIICAVVPRRELDASAVSTARVVDDVIHKAEEDIHSELQDAAHQNILIAAVVTVSVLLVSGLITYCLVPSLPRLVSLMYLPWSRGSPSDTTDLEIPTTVPPALAALPAGEGRSV